MSRTDSLIVAALGAVCVLLAFTPAGGDLLLIPGLLVLAAAARGATTGNGWTRPRHGWWSDVAGVEAFLYVYGLVRQHVTGTVGAAIHNARTVVHVEQVVGLGWEHAVNAAVTGHALLVQVCGGYYATAHFLVTPAVMVWLYRRHPAGYRWRRWSLALTSLVALGCFALLPVAPPRMFAGYTDTLRGAEHLVAGLTNPFAAMPSLHVAWAAWVLLALWRSRWWGLGVAHLLLTSVVVVATANHYTLDVAAGVAVAVASEGVLRYARRRSVHRLRGVGAVVALPRVERQAA